MAKNLFLAAILNFPDETGSRFSKPMAVCPNRDPTWTHAVGILKKILISLGAMVVQNTDRHTDIHTYIHTDRQTELKYYIRRDYRVYAIYDMTETWLMEHLIYYLKN